MEENIIPEETQDNNRIIPINIEEQMKMAYIDYSMSVIVSGPCRMCGTDLNPFTAVSFME